MTIEQLKMEFQKYKWSVLEVVKATTSNRLPIQAEHFAKWNLDVLNNIEKMINAVDVPEDVIDTFELHDAWKTV